MRIPLLLLDIFLFLAIAYLYFFVLVYWLRRKKDIPPQDPREPFPKLAVLIPAHNEESGIEATLISVKRADYPVSDLKIYVIADNCTDMTAALAERHTQHVYERNDIDNRGKGFALEWAMENTDILNSDAIVFLDSDCVIPQNFLKVMASYLQRGERIIQAYYDTIWDIKNPFSILSHLGNVLDNRLLIYPKLLLKNLTALLQGTGMCMSSDVLRQHPWKSFSITEDIEYSLDFILAGGNISYTIHTSCIQVEASTRNAMKGQKIRWTSGWILLLRKYTGKLLNAYWNKKDYRYLDILFSLFLQNRTLYLSFIILAMAYSFLLANTVYILIQLLLIGLFGVYVGIGFFVSGLHRQKGAWKGIAFSPFYLAWMFGVFAYSLVGSTRNDWFRTPRSKGESGTLPKDMVR